MSTEVARRRLADVADVVMGQSPPGSTYNEDRVGLPFIQGAAEFGRRYPAPEKYCSSPQKVAEPGDLLISVRAPVGRINFAHERLAIGRGLAIIRAGPQIAAEYLAIALEAELPQLLARSGTGMFRSITGAALKDIELALPPAELQLEVASTVGGAEAVVAGSAHHAAAVRRFRTALRQKTIGDLQPRVGTVELSTLGRFARGGSFPRAEQGRRSGDHPVFKVNDMNTEGNERALRKPENWVTEDQRRRLKMKLWPAGTVVFARVGAALTGDRRRLLVRQSVLDDNLLGLVPDPELVSPYFLMLALESVPLSKMAQQGAVPSVNARMVGAISVPVPGLDEQRDIEDCFRAVDAVEEAARLRLELAERLRLSLIGHYFDQAPAADPEVDSISTVEAVAEPA